MELDDNTDNYVHTMFTNQDIDMLNSPTPSPKHLDDIIEDRWQEELVKNKFANEWLLTTTGIELSQNN